MKRISILGPECTGKTTLARALAQSQQGVWVKEAARKYIQELDRPYKFPDLLQIAHQQIANEDRLAALKSNAPFLFCDTDITVLYIWSLDKFGRAEAQLEQLFEEREYDAYFICKPDMPWEDDGLREDQHRRDELLETYETVLEQFGKPYHLISGSLEERLKSAATILEQL